jgi:hypothetical protein
MLSTPVKQLRRDFFSLSFFLSSKFVQGGQVPYTDFNMHEGSEGYFLRMTLVASKSDVSK